MPYDRGSIHHPIRQRAPYAIQFQLPSYLSRIQQQSNSSYLLKIQRLYNKREKQPRKLLHITEEMDYHSCRTNTEGCRSFTPYLPNPRRTPVCLRYQAGGSRPTRLINRDLELPQPVDHHGAIKTI